MAVLSLAVGAAMLAAGCGDTGGESGGGGGGGEEKKAEFRRPITMVVGFGPGSGSDMAARLVAPVLEKGTGVQVPVVNAPGATGNTGMTKMLQGRPGETLVVMPADTLATVVGGTASFKLDEIAPVCRISSAPSSLWTNTKGDYKDWDALSKAAEEEPGKITVATVGKGGIDDIMLGALAQKGYEFRAVPFAENSERKGALLSQDVDVLYEQAGDVKENIDSKQFAPVLMFGSEKSPLEGDYTLSSEVGVTDVIDQWRGLFAHGEMPQGQVAKFSEACLAADDDPAFTKFREAASELDGGFMSTEEFQPFIKENLAQMQKLGKQYGVYK